MHLKPSIYKRMTEKDCKKNIFIEENNVFICLDGLPTALKRHRSCILNGRVHTYDSQKELKETVLKCVLMQLPKDFKPFTVPVEMLVEFHMSIPESISKKKKRLMKDTFHGKKPDLSNLIKFLEDVFNGVIYKDDSLIARVMASKIHSLEPKTILCFRECFDDKPLEFND